MFMLGVHRLKVFLSCPIVLTLVTDTPIFMALNWFYEMRYY